MNKKKEIKTIAELFHFKNTVEAFYGEIPDNLIIVSPEIINESLEWMGKDSKVFKHKTGVQIYGVNVIRDYAELVHID